MAIVRDLIESYTIPGTVVRRQLAAGVGEERLLAYVMLASVFTFAARLPWLLRLHAQIVDGPELSTFIGTNMVASLIFVPLFLYGLAALSHLIAKIVGGQGDWFAARLALFWSLLALQPLVLIRGYLVVPYAEKDTTTVVTWLLGVLFLAVWFVSLWAVEQNLTRQQRP